MNKENIRQSGVDLANKIVAKTKRKTHDSCGSDCPYSENGDLFCRKVEGHKGCHSAIIEWD